MIVGFTCSAFDLFHAGHIAMLKECKEQCDYLVVGLQTDPSIDRKHKNKPIQSILERYIQLEACKYIDKIIPYDTEKDLENLIGIIRPTKRFVGVEYMRISLTGTTVCMQVGTEIIYNTRNHSYSSTELRKRIHDASVTTHR